MARSLWFIILTVLCVGSVTAHADTNSDLEKKVVSYRLPNGMTWLLLRRPSSPVFAGTVMVKVGGLDEMPPKIGLAHMFEHMAFKGTRTVGTRDYQKEEPILKQIAAAGAEWVKSPNADTLKKLNALQAQAKQYQIPNELFSILVRNGARGVNAYTSKDVTNYFSQMPANKLALWLYLYSGMVGDPILREFYPERNVVQEERRSSVENNPRGRAYEKLWSTSFTQSPYQYSNIGTAAQISGLTMEDAQVFHAAHYYPGNMVGVLVGDINISETKRLISQFFGPLPARKPAEQKTIDEPQQTEERRAEIKVDGAPFLMMAFHKPKIGTTADYAFDLITYIMCDAASSRLQRELILERKVARAINCASAVPGNRLDNLFYIYADPLKSHSPAQLEKLILQALAQLRDHGVTAAELEKARTNMAAELIMKMDSNDELAQQLAGAQTLAGDWRYLTRYVKRITQLSAADVQQVAQKYLIPTNMTVITAVRQ